MLSTNICHGQLVVSDVRILHIMVLAYNVVSEILGTRVLYARSKRDRTTVHLLQRSFDGCQKLNHWLAHTGKTVLNVAFELVAEN